MGQHSDEILEEAGFTAEEIERFEAEGAIVRGPAGGAAGERTEGARE